MPSATDSAVLAIIRDVLNTGDVSPEDDFYDFGGTSLQAVRICVRVKSELGREVSPDALFDAERIADFLAAVASDE